MSGHEFDLPPEARGEAPQGVPKRRDIYFAPNLVHSPGPDEEAIVEQLSNRFGPILVDAMKANDVLPPNLTDPDEERK